MALFVLCFSHTPPCYCPSRGLITYVAWSPPQDQTEWLLSSSGRVAFEFGGMPAILFVHIPPPAMVNMTAGPLASECMGIAQENYHGFDDQGDVCACQERWELFGKYCWWE